MKRRPNFPSPDQLGTPGAVQSQALAQQACLLCVLPWLNPFSWGPVASAIPWLLTAVLVSTVAIATAMSAPRWPTGLVAWPIVLALVIVVLAMPRPFGLVVFEALGLVAGVALTVLAMLTVRQAQGVWAGKQPLVWYLTAVPWLLAGLVSSAFALSQYFGHAGHLSPWVNWAPLGEAFANLRQRNQFASLTNIALAALLAAPFSVAGRGRSGGSLAPAVAKCAAIALLVIGNAASASRTGAVQLVAVSVFLIVWRRERGVAAWSAWVCTAYAIGLLALPWAAGFDPTSHGMFARLREGNELCASRLTLWSNVLHLIAQRPWLGWGWGELDYAHFITLYDGPRFCDILDNAHNLPLHLAVELGLPASVLFCGGVGWWVWRSKPWRETDPMRQMAWLVIVIIGIHSLLEYPLWYGPFQVALGLSLGVLCRPSTTLKADTMGSGSWWSQLTPPVALAVLMFAACMYTAWDYRRISQIYLDPLVRAPEYRFDTLGKIEDTWLFQRQVRFAELTTTPLRFQNAERLHGLALELLHFSPEKRVVERLIDSARLLGKNEEAGFYEKRLRAAYPSGHENR
jgi:O-antigen ligase